MLFRWEDFKNLVAAPLTKARITRQRDVAKNPNSLATVAVTDHQ